MRSSGNDCVPLVGMNMLGAYLVIVTLRGGSTNGAFLRKLVGVGLRNVGCSVVDDLILTCKLILGRWPSKPTPKPSPEGSFGLYRAEQGSAIKQPTLLYN